MEKQREETRQAVERFEEIAKSYASILCESEKRLGDTLHHVERAADKTERMIYVGMVNSCELVKNGAARRIAEIEEEMKQGNAVNMEKEFGDLLFSLVNASRLYGINPDNALEQTNNKFRRRFTYVEEHSLGQGRNLNDMSLAEMDALWNEAKKDER